MGCEHNGVSYQEGQVFQPSCALQCRCSGGGVTCVPRCSEDVLLPSPDCPHPRRVQQPGKCCKEWVCENMDNTVLQDAHIGTLFTFFFPANKSKAVVVHVIIYFMSWKENCLLSFGILHKSFYMFLIQIPIWEHSQLHSRLRFSLWDFDHLIENVLPKWNPKAQILASSRSQLSMIHNRTHVCVTQQLNSRKPDRV